MPRYVLILDPHPHRRAPFELASRSVLPNHQVVLVETTAALNDHLLSHAHETELFSLDYLRAADAIQTLLALPPIAPVLLHVNPHMHPGSDRRLYPEAVLERLQWAGWPASIVPGTRHDTWIRKEWGPAVWKLCERDWIRRDEIPD